MASNSDNSYEVQPLTILPAVVPALSSAGTFSRYLQQQVSTAACIVSASLLYHLHSSKTYLFLRRLFFLITSMPSSLVGTARSIAFVTQRARPRCWRLV